VYDAAGPSAGPGHLLSTTAEFNPVVGWNTVDVIAPVSVPSGSYWISVFNDTALPVSNASAGASQRSLNMTYGALPAQIITGIANTTWRYSLYATGTVINSTDPVYDGLPTTIHFTTDGSTPTINSPVYSSPILVEHSINLQFFAKDPAGNTEALQVEKYVIPIHTTATLTGTYPTKTITLTCDDPSAVTYYTLDGSEPDSATIFADDSSPYELDGGDQATTDGGL
jgi:hypothetical protein